MLKKNKVEEKTNEVENKPAPEAPQSAPPAAARTQTIIGEQITIEGGLKGNDDLIIEGSVNGKIELQKNHLTIGHKGRVEAEIHAGNVTISGRLTGNINASGKVAITKGANFNGEIKAKSISVEDGAMLKAVIELDQSGAQTSQTGVSSVSNSSPAEQAEPKGEKDTVFMAGAEKKK